MSHNRQTITNEITTAGTEVTAMEVAVVRTLTLRLVPFLFLLYIVAYLDRINVGFAALQMQQQLGFTDAVYGLGAGMFFAGYFCFQVPSNLVLERVGARRWIACLMVTWGIISAATALASGPRSFYLLRFLLGSAEAGFYPGVILYLKNWFPTAARARTVARFMTAAPLSGVVGGPVSGALLGLHMKAGLAGWQWMFLMEGIPAVLLGAAAWAYLVDRPEEAKWLDAEERQWLLGVLRREAAQSVIGSEGGVQGSRVQDPGQIEPTRQMVRASPALPAETWAGLCSGRIWMLAFVYFGLNTVSYGVSMWLPKLIKSLSGLGNFTIGVVSAIPYVVAAGVMVRVGLHSDRSGERRWHTAGPAFAGAIALALAAYSSSVAPAILGISVAVLGVFSMVGPFWTMPAALLSEAAAATGIAFINSLGNLGGFFGPYIIGLVRGSTGTFRGGLLVVAATLSAAGLVALQVKLAPVPER